MPYLCCASLHTTIGVNSYPGFLFQLVPQSLKPLAALGKREFEGRGRDGHELLSLDIVGKSKWDHRVLTVCYLKGAGERKIIF